MSSINYIQDNTTLVDTLDDSNQGSAFSFNIEIELDSLIELILNSTKIPLTEFAIVERDILLDQLNLIKDNLPTDLATAIEIANCRQQIIAEAESYAFLVVKSAEEQASQILKDSEILRQAELDGAKIRLKTERECDELKQSAIAESQSIQIEADHYADNVLGDLEHRLQQMLEIVQNGRQQLDS